SLEPSSSNRSPTKMGSDPLSGSAPFSVPSFVHLRVHTEYSLVDSVVRVGPLIEAIDRLGMAAVAVTDQGNLSAMVKVYKAAIARGIKPIIGADVWTADSHDDREPHRLTFL